MAGSTLNVSNLNIYIDSTGQPSFGTVSGYKYTFKITSGTISPKSTGSFMIGLCTSTTNPTGTMLCNTGPGWIHTINATAGTDINFSTTPVTVEFTSNNSTIDQFYIVVGFKIGSNQVKTAVNTTKYTNNYSGNSVTGSGSVNPDLS